MFSWFKKKQTTPPESKLDVVKRLCTSWKIAQALEGFCAQRGYAPWNSFYRETDAAVIANWVAGLRQALEKFLDLELIASESSEGDYAILYNGWDEYQSEAQRVRYPSRNWVTLELDYWPPALREYQPARALTLGDVFTHSSQPLISALLSRFNKKQVAPYSMETLVPALASAGKSCVCKPCWSYTRGASTYMMLLAVESASGLGVSECVLLPQAWQVARGELDHPLNQDLSGACVVFDAHAHQRFVRLSTLTSNNVLAELPVALYTSAQVYGYLYNYGQCAAYAALSANAPEIAAIRALTAKEQIPIFCNLINAEGESLIPPSTRVLAGTLDDEGCVICPATPERQDWFSLAQPHLAINRPLRWRKVAGGNEDRRAVQSPENHCWGYISKSGELVIAPQFASAGFFHRGLAEVSLPAAPDVFGLINNAGQFLVTPAWLDLRWSSADCVAVKNVSGEWGILKIPESASVLTTKPQILVPFQPAHSWLAAYDAQPTGRKVSWGEKTDEEKIIEQMEIALIDAKATRITNAKAAPNLALLTGLFDGNTRARELARLGVWGMRVEVVAFAGCDQRHEKLVGQQGVIMSHYPVSLSTFDLTIEAPLEGLASYPNAVMGVPWAGLKWINI